MVKCALCGAEVGKEQPGITEEGKCDICRHKLGIEK